MTAISRRCTAETGAARRRARGAVALGLALVLAACQGPSAVPHSHPALVLDRAPPLRFDVAAIDVIDHSHPVATRPLPVEPGAAVAAWARAHFQPVGAAGTLQVVIDDATLTETPLPVGDGIGSSLTVEQDRRYDGRLKVSLFASIPNRLTTGQAEAAVTRSRTTDETMTPFQRDQVLLDLTQGMIDDLAARLDAEARENLSVFVR